MNPHDADHAQAEIDRGDDRAERELTVVADSPDDFAPLCEVCAKPILDTGQAHFSHRAACPVVTDGIVAIDACTCAPLDETLAHDGCCRVCAALTDEPALAG